MLKRGQLVIVTAPAGTVMAEVIHVEEPKNLPVVNSRKELTQVQAIMRERGIVQLALLAHDFYGPGKFTSGGKPIELGPGKQQVTFAALLNGAGQWHDLQGNLLTIVPKGEAPTDD